MQPSQAKCVAEQLATLFYDEIYTPEDAEQVALLLDKHYTSLAAIVRLWVRETNVSEDEILIEDNQ